MNLYNPAQTRYLARLFDTVLNVLYTADPETLSSDPSGLPASAPEEAALSSPESSSAPLSLSSSSSPPHHHALSHSHSHSNGHSPHHSHSPPFTLEDRRLQLTKALSQLNAEHSSLTTALKTARRESQKADAALRAEIDALKRAADRHAAGESRARKKVLALQEAVKQTLAAARDIEALVRDVEAALPGLEERKMEVEREWEEARMEAAYFPTGDKSREALWVRVSERSLPSSLGLPPVRTILSIPRPSSSTSSSPTPPPPLSSLAAIVAAVSNIRRALNHYR